MNPSNLEQDESSSSSSLSLQNSNQVNEEGYENVNVNAYFDYQAEGYYSNGDGILQTYDDDDDDEDDDNDDGSSSVENASLGEESSSSSSSSSSSEHGNNVAEHDDHNMNNEQEEESEEEEIPLPAARQHTYLPGTTNPLYPEQWLLQSSSITSFQLKNDKDPHHHHYHHPQQQRYPQSSSLSTTVVLPILQLEGIVLFPNSTLPLRLKHSSWINYLSRAIAFARDGGIGMNSIFPTTQDTNVTDARNHYHQSRNTTSTSTTTTTSSSSNTHYPIVYNFNGNDTLSNRDIQVRIGILTKLNSSSSGYNDRNRRRRRGRILRSRRRQYDIMNEESVSSSERTTTTSTTTNHDPQEQDQNQEQQNVQEQGTNNHTNHTNRISNSTTSSRRNDDDTIIRDFRMGRWNMSMLRRGVIPNSQSRGYNHDDDNDDNNDDDHDESGDGDGDGDGVGDNNNSSGQNSLLPIHERFLHPLNPSSESVDPLIHRIGTLATITYTHEDGRLGNGNDRTMIVTALTTGRFRIVKRASHENNDGRPINDEECQLYHVEEIVDDCVQTPLIKSKQIKVPSQHPNTKKDDDFMIQSPNDVDIGYKHHHRMIQTLSKISPIPTCALKKVWPCKLAEDILSEIASNDALHGLWKSLPKCSGRYILQSKKDCRDTVESNDSKVVHIHHNIPYCVDRSQFDPVSFSFWVAANLPFSDVDKLDILEMNHIERLRFLLDKLIQQRNVIRYMRCKHCGSKIAKIADLFTVKGAEGTSGAYVNEHGCIHQTVTVKTVEYGSTICMGGPETKDSWFPGYSWTILCCQFCYMHLGWKFQRVLKTRGRNNDNDGERTFWGLSGSNITTEKLRLL